MAELKQMALRWTSWEDISWDLGMRGQEVAFRNGFKVQNLGLRV